MISETIDAYSQAAREPHSSDSQGIGMDQETVDLLEKECGFKMVNADTGQACSEFLFGRTGAPAQSTNVKEFMAKKRAAHEAEKAARTAGQPLDVVAEPAVSAA